jgi:LysR family transcriptional regulator, hydrogen peroxide-inducible genes activator
MLAPLLRHEHSRVLNNGGDMTLQELRYLVALADKGHFARAAEACHVGQPTLSTQLKKLEDYLGVTLFERNKHHLRATPIGEQIIEQARIALSVVGQIKELARRGLDPMNGPLRLGVIPTLGPYLIPHLLPDIRERFPELHLFLREDLTSHLLERLRQGRLDVLLLALPVNGDDVETLELFRESFVVALPSDHRLAAQREVTQADLVPENVLLLEEGHCMRDQALAICGEQSSDQREELKATSIETLRQMVAAGVGCTLLPRLASLPGTGSLHGDTVQIRPFEQPVPTRTIGLAWRRQYPRESTVRILAEWICERLPKEVENLTATRIDRHAVPRPASPPPRRAEALSAHGV